ncbi:MAG: pterin-4-alpha-carbinolamine dehydratase [Sphingobacteriia bacterium]|nr:pterin-4-alpha-carbinolamine dehydratase [Sphingobacteriia bacterium]NCC40699.1 pterin-4-alpha-carbinolamine dehydratase [Gammaproteobacteria bacterium]
MHPDWHFRQRPPRLERRIEFVDYASTRDFLDRAAGVSEDMGLYPDMSFGRTYVNITLHAEEGASEIGQSQRRYAEALDALMTPEQIIHE